MKRIQHQYKRNEPEHPGVLKELLQGVDEGDQEEVIRIHKYTRGKYTAMDDKTIQRMKGKEELWLTVEKFYPLNDRVPLIYYIYNPEKPNLEGERMLSVFKKFLQLMRTSEYDGFETLGAMIDCADEHLFCQHALGGNRLNAEPGIFYRQVLNPDDEDNYVVIENPLNSHLRVTDPQTIRKFFHENKPPLRKKQRSITVEL